MTDHTNLVKRLRRIEGQIGGIINMIEDGRYCIDILGQTKAARSALKGVESEILETHMQSCVTAALSSGNTTDAKAKVDELMDLFKRGDRS